MISRTRPRSWQSALHSVNVSGPICTDLASWCLPLFLFFSLKQNSICKKLKWMRWLVPGLEGQLASIVVQLLSISCASRIRISTPRPGPSTVTWNLQEINHLQKVVKNHSPWYIVLRAPSRSESCVISSGCWKAEVTSTDYLNKSQSSQLEPQLFWSWHARFFWRKWAP